MGTLKKAPDGLSWLAESRWPPNSTPPKGALSMDPVTYRRLVEFLKTQSHTGLGRARSPMTRDVGGINALAREMAYAQSADHVIGPRHALFDDAMGGII
jgi:hypothetical protein